MYELLIVFSAAFLATLLLTPNLMKKLAAAGIIGRDVNKPDKPEIPEMGGIAIVAGLCAGIMATIAMSTFFGFEINIVHLMAATSTLLIMALIGIFDDLFRMSHIVKASLPLAAALPLMAVLHDVTTSMTFPLIGTVEFDAWYVLLLVPVGIAGASNVTNMLAGFNGMEAGMGFVACSSLAIVAWKTGSTESLVLLVSMSAALLAFLRYNRFPARVFIGDIGTLSIGAVIATSVILGNFESLGMIVITPYAVDFFIKAANRFPSTGWWGQYKNGKLYCEKRPVGLCQVIMKLSGGISEKNLTLSLIMAEAVFGALAVSMVM